MDLKSFKCKNAKCTTKCKQKKCPESEQLCPLQAAGYRFYQNQL